MLTYRKSETPSTCKVGWKYSVLGIVERAIPDRCDDFTKDKERIAIEVIRGRSGHYYCTTHMETCHDDRKKGPTPFINTKPNPDT